MRGATAVVNRPRTWSSSGSFRRGTSRLEDHQRPSAVFVNRPGVSCATPRRHRCQSAELESLLDGDHRAAVDELVVAEHRGSHVQTEEVLHTHAEFPGK